MHQTPESETYFHPVTEHKHDDAFNMYKRKRPQRISEAEYLQQEQDVCDQRGKRKNHSRTDSCRYTGHSPKIAKISSGLPSYDQHVTALSVLIPKQEHHGKMNFSIWKKSIRNHVFILTPADFSCRLYFHSVSSAQLSFVPRECMGAKKRQFVTDCCQWMERKKGSVCPRNQHTSIAPHLAQVNQALLLRIRQCLQNLNTQVLPAIGTNCLEQSHWFW